ncbi:hypothetical protein [Levilactobacillus angrenensis]|uniref:Uncharacterized protein n=1 Tax=Levilactobacillus angrenensis TaxID=2486020 RepID=A0ABW1U960_9LACO|nr:hypothetical protein [Levilactobacillus angrenensis]
MKKIVYTTLAIGLALTGLGVANPTTASAKTTYLPKAVRSHTWYRLTDGAQGGFHDKTTFKGNHFTIKVKGASLRYHWHFTGLKKHTKTTYYGRLHYSKKRSELVKVKVFSHKHFDIIPKHVFHLAGNYTGNESYGAMIFKR